MPGGEKVCPAWCQLGLLGRQEGASRKTRCCQRAKGKSFLLVLLGRWRDSLTQLAKQSPVPIPRPLGLLWRIPASFFRASGDHRPAPLCRAAVAGINQQPSHPRALQLVKKPAPPGPPQYPGLAFRRLAGGSPLPAAGRRGEWGAPCPCPQTAGCLFFPSPRGRWRHGEVPGDGDVTGGGRGCSRVGRRNKGGKASACDERCCAQHPLPGRGGLGVSPACSSLVGRRAQARDPEGGSKVCRVAKEQRLLQPACCWEKGLRETCWGECGSFGERATLRQSQELGVHEDAPLH